jgi:hypothetical protein
MINVINPKLKDLVTDTCTPFGREPAGAKRPEIHLPSVTQVSQAVESAGAMKFELSDDEPA